MFDFIKKVVETVRKIVSNVAKTVSSWFGGGDGSGSSSSSGGGGSWGGDDEREEQKRRREAARRRQQAQERENQAAAQFDKDVDTHTKSPFQFPIHPLPVEKSEDEGLDLSQAVLTPVDMDDLIDNIGHPLFHTVQLMLMHERGVIRGAVNAAGSVEAGMNALLARWNWDEDQDNSSLVRYISKELEKYADVDEVAYSRRGDIDESVLQEKTFGKYGELDGYTLIKPVGEVLQKPLLQTDGVTPTPTPQFVNPCASDDRECYINELARYNIIIPSDEFTGENVQRLGIILESAFVTGSAMTVYMNEGTSPEQAFRQIFGSVEFLYDPNADFALTVVPDDNPITGRQTATITLGPGSFPTEGLDSKFVVIHELGHVFHNRHGNAIGDIQIEGTAIDQIVANYVAATGAYWNPGGDDYTSDYVQPGRYWVEEKIDENTGATIYYIPAGTYLAANLVSSETRPSLFPNEIGSAEYQREIGSENYQHPSPHPREGFADSFAALIISPDDFSTAEPRRTYIEGNMSTWVDDITDSNE